jgi:hypothetical protein
MTTGTTARCPARTKPLVRHSSTDASVRSPRVVWCPPCRRETQRVADFWVYENRVPDRARVHRSTCVCGNDRDGLHNTTTTAYGRRLSFDSYRLAVASVTMNRSDARPCPHCKPNR